MALEEQKEGNQYRCASEKVVITALENRLKFTLCIYTHIHICVYVYMYIYTTHTYAHTHTLEIF